MIKAMLSRFTFERSNSENERSKVLACWSPMLAFTGLYSSCPSFHHLHCTLSPQIMHLLHFASLIATIASLARGYTITVVNNCGETIYAAAGETNVGFSMNPNAPSQAEFDAGRVRFVHWHVE